MSQHNHVIVLVVHCTDNLSTRHLAVTDVAPVLPRRTHYQLLATVTTTTVQLMITLITLARIIPRGKEDIDEESGGGEGEAARSSGNSAVIAAAHLL